MDKLIGYYYRGKAWWRSIKISRYKNTEAYTKKLKRYTGLELLNVDQANGEIYKHIINGEPFFAGRFGAFEILNMRASRFGTFLGSKHSMDVHFKFLCNNAGFFPQDISLLREFRELMENSCKQVDFLAVWFQPFEDYYIKKYMNRNIKISYLFDFEPWKGSVHWSAALKGKKVLVIHPFAETIQKQYLNKAEIFPNSDILPDFELKTLKAVQTIAGAKDDRFQDWFEALEWLYNEAIRIDFDIAIVGCGAYGFPLCAKLKAAGKQAIHLAGATQLLFGIKGKRWESSDVFNYVNKQFNEAWVYPSIEDAVENSNQVEGSCYW